MNESKSYHIAGWGNLLILKTLTLPIKSPNSYFLVRIFSALWLNTRIYSVNLCFQSKKYGRENTDQKKKWIWALFTWCKWRRFGIFITSNTKYSASIYCSFLLILKRHWLAGNSRGRLAYVFLEKKGSEKFNKIHRKNLKLYPFCCKCFFANVTKIFRTFSEHLWTNGCYKNCLKVCDSRMDWDWGYHC